MGKAARSALAVALLLAPAPALAVRFSEIMYDLPSPGSDDGREWIEIVGGEAAIDLASWRLREGGINHKFATTSVTLSLALPAGAYAIVADDPEKFLADWPSYAGLLLKSSFSLSNSGETLALQDADGNVADEVTYSSSWGAAGDGNSLHRADGSWQAAASTPGAPPAEAGGEGEPPAPAEPTPSSPASPGAGGGTPAPLPAIRVSAGGDRTLVVGADAVFEASAFGENGTALQNARFLWNFGNGAIREGKRVLFHYGYPGTYVVTLSVSSGELSGSARFLATAARADVGIASVTEEYVSLFNREARYVDISHWMLAAGTSTFAFPAGTLLAPRSETPVPRSAIGLSPGISPILTYPNGREAAAPPLPTPAVSIAKAPPPPPPPPASAGGGEDAPAPAAAPAPEREAAAANLASFSGAAPFAALLLLVALAAGAAFFLERRARRDSFTIIEEN